MDGKTSKGMTVLKELVDHQLKCDAIGMCRWIMYQPSLPKGLKEKFGNK